MKVINPVLTNTQRLEYSNLPEDTHPDYSPSTAYVEGNIVRVFDGNIYRLYEALKASTGRDPLASYSKEDKPWLNLGATNRWKMFDQVVGNRSAGSYEFSDESGRTGIEVQIAPGQVVNFIAFFGLNADYVQVVVIDPVDGEVYNRTKSLSSTLGINDWLSYYFSPIENVSDISVDDLPNYGSALITLRFGRTSGDAQVGLTLMGLSQEIGISQYGSSVGILDFSKKERDQFGNFTVVERPYAKLINMEVIVDSNRLDFVAGKLAELRAKPVVWSGTSVFGAFLVYGYYKDFDLVTNNYDEAKLNMKLEGLT